nr:putative inorganic phosphate transporter 1-9 [Quercus suber]
MEIPMDQIVEDNVLPPTPPPYPLLSKQFFQRHGRDLFSCSFTWFLVDIAFYSSNFFQSRIYYDHLQTKESMNNDYEDALNFATFQVIIAACFTIPGYWFTVYFIDRIGRVKIQMMGFFLMALVYLALGISYHAWTKNKQNKGFLFLYGLTFFFANFGPNTTTFIVPAELFPARFRSTCHGISGAIGKVGAIIGSVGFVWVKNHKKDGKPKVIDDMAASFIILAGVCLLGTTVTYFFTRETMGRSLEENED